MFATIAMLSPLSPSNLPNAVQSRVADQLRYPFSLLGVKLPIARIILAVIFILAGSLHFLIPQTYVRIMPPYLPAHLQLVYISGFFEMLGGLGLFAPASLQGFPARSAAAWGLVALLIAVMPANIYMVTNHAKFAFIPLWALWLRLPLQLPLIWWAWLYTRA
jgi:uncharacterized membrane protein